MMSPLVLVVAVAFFTGLLAPVLAFSVLIVAQVRRRIRGEGPRCLQCDGPLLPLLDGNHAFLGEAACLNCGRLHEGLQAGHAQAPSRRGPAGDTV